MPFESQKQRAFMYAKHPKLAKEFEKETPEGKKLPEYADHPDGIGLFDLIKLSEHRAQQRNYQKQQLVKQRPSPQQTTIKEFQEETTMITPTQNAAATFGMVKNLRPSQGNNKETRGTQMTTVPTQPTPTLAPTKPTGGITPMGTNKGPMKKVADNVTNAVSRKVQSNFNAGPNGVNNLTGLSNKTPNMERTPQERMEINKMITENVSKSHSSYGADNKMGKMQGSQKSALVSFFGLEDNNHVGSGIDLKAMFQDSSFKKSKPTEVMQCNENKGKFISSEKKK